MIECIAWDLVGKYSELVDVTHEIMVGGRVAYHSAVPARGEQSVRIQRLDPGPPLKQITRYIAAEAPVTLVAFSDHSKVERLLCVAEEISSHLA